MAQIGCYLTDEEAQQLDDYARSFDLTRPSLCVLLVQRELCMPRMPMGDRVPDTIVKGPRRVTVHLRNPRVKESFNRHIEKLGMGSDLATSVILRRELRERWMEQTFMPAGIAIDSSNNQP